MKLTREQWLNKALHSHVAPLLAKHGATVPKDCLVSVGWPGGGSARKRIGEAWPRARSSKKVNQIFISPSITDDPVKMLDILVHEACHVADDCKSGHKGPFKKLALAVGLTGKMTATVAGPELSKWIKATIKKLPKIAHSKLDLSGRVKQTTRLLLVKCGGCGMKLRVTEKWLPNIEGVTCNCGGTLGAA